VNMKFNKKAFTLTELIIALGVIGVLATILMPVITNMIPDQNAIMAKRAYYAVQTIVSDIINDGDCYPDTSKSSSEDLQRIGFDDGYKYPDCKDWKAENDDYYTEDEIETLEDGTEVIKHRKGDPKEYSAKVKFITLFKKELDIKDGEKTETGREKFVTRDGIRWGFENTAEFDSRKMDKDAGIWLYIDINGTKKPNKIYHAPSTNPFGSTQTKDASTYDTFAIRIFADGSIRINPDDGWLNRVLDIDYDISGNNEGEDEY